MNTRSRHVNLGGPMDCDLSPLELDTEQPMKFIPGHKWLIRAFVAFAIVSMISVVAIGIINVSHLRAVDRQLAAQDKRIDLLGRHDITVDAVLKSHGLANMQPDGATDVSISQEP